jgi:hypothetical protein
MATTTPNFGWVVPTSTDLVKDGATAIETLGDAIDASLLDLKGGTTGQVLSKNSNTDMDFTWVAQDDSNAIQNAIVDAKGDLIGATANDTPARLAVGTNGQVLTADSTASTGLAWATPASGGFTQLATGTLSGASTVVSLTLTGYRDLVAYVLNPIASTSSTNFQITLGGTTTYQSNQMYSINGAASANRTTSADSKIEWQFGSLFSIPTSSDNRNSTTLRVFNVTATNGKTAQLNLGLAGPARVNCFQSIVLEEANAVTGITFATTSGSFSGGTYTIWGVK